MSERLSDELQGLIGDEAFLALVERFGGDRLYVPKSVGGTELEQAVGAAAAAKLSSRYAGDYPRIPLARAFRARHYRHAGMNNPAIARKLGMTVTGVEKLFLRTPTQRPRKSDPRQMTMFD